MNKLLILVLVLFGLGIGGGAAYIYFGNMSQSDTIAEEVEGVVSDKQVEEENKEKEVEVEAEETEVATDSSDRPIGGMGEPQTYQGELLAGSSSLYYVFNQSDYEKALAEGKIIFLEFYADWCPICRVEQPDIEDGFNELTRSDVVGFRVNYRDDDTDDDERALAREYDIAYQHTKVVLVDGEEVLRSGEAWSKSRFLENINAL